MIILQGTWVQFDKAFSKSGNIAVDGNEMTFEVRDLRTDTLSRKTAKYELQSANYLLGDCECYDIQLEPGDYPQQDFMCHMENINGKEIPVISQMIMEYDGRGRIVRASYVRKEDRTLVNEDYETRLYKACNKRTATPMSRINPESGAMPGTFVGMSGIMNMTAVKETEQSCEGETWTCSCGRTGNTRRFCEECGLPGPKEWNPEKGRQL